MTSMDFQQEITSRKSFNGFPYWRFIMLGCNIN